MDMEKLEKECCVCGYHEYMAVWEAAVGEELECRHQQSDATDRYAMVVCRNGDVVGHLLKKLAVKDALAVHQKRWFSSDIFTQER